MLFALAVFPSDATVTLEVNCSAVLTNAPAGLACSATPSGSATATSELAGTARFLGCTSDVFERLTRRRHHGRRHGTLEAEGRQQILAPMPGKIIRVLVQTGEKVDAGQGLLVVEAMKMQNEIRSPKSGTVERVLVKEGQPVNAGEILAWID